MLIEVFSDKRFFSIADTDGSIILSLNDNSAFDDWASTNFNHMCIINGPCESYLLTLIHTVMLFRTDGDSQIIWNHLVIAIFTMHNNILHFLVVILKWEAVLVSLVIVVVVILYSVVIVLNCV